MTGIVLVVALILIFVLWLKQDNLQERIKKLENEIYVLKEKLLPDTKTAAAKIVQRYQDNAESKPAPPAAKVPSPLIPEPPGLPASMAQATPTSPQPAPKPVPKAVSESVSKPLPRPQTVVAKPKMKSDWWDKLVEQFIRNWTGIIGSVLMVMGVGFLGIYAALKCSPVYRCLIIAAFALLLTIVSFILRRYSKWRPLASWLRSSAGAVILFACTGAGYIPGLQWIQTSTPALGCLVLGIGINLYLAVAGGQQVIASLHVLLSLVALAFAPVSSLVLGVATAIAIMGIALTYREKWETHLLLTTVVYFLFHLYWYFNLGAQAMPGSDHWSGLTSISAIGISALLIHYRSVYQTARLQVMPFLVHLTTWSWLGIGFALHTPNLAYVSALIGLGAVAAFFLARRARILGIRWLYVTDTLIAQLLALLALAALQQIKMGAYWILGAMFMQTLIFSLVMKMEKESNLCKVGIGLAVLLNAALIVGGFGWPRIFENPHVVLIVCALATAALTLVLHRSGENCDNFLGVMLEVPPKRNLYNLSLLETGAGVMLLPAYASIYTLPWAGYLLAGVVLLLLILRQIMQSNGLGLGLIVLLTGATAWEWQQVVHLQTSPAACLWYALPFFLLAVAAIFLSYIQHIQKSIRWFGLTLFYFNLAYITYILGTPVYPLIYVVAALLIETLAYLVLIHWLDAKFIQHPGLALANLLAAIAIGTALSRFDQAQLLLRYQTAAALLVLMLAVAGYTFFARRKNPEGKGQLQVLEFLLPGMLTCIFIILHDLSWVGYATAAVAVPLLMLRQRSQATGLGLGLVMFLLVSAGLGWHWLQFGSRAGLLEKIVYSLPLFGLALAALKMASLRGLQKPVKWIGIYLFYAHCLAAAYVFCNSISPFIPGVIWLCLSLIPLEIAVALQKRPPEVNAGEGDTARYLLHAGYVLLAAFLLRHLVVHIQSEAFWFGLIRIRLAIEVLTLLVFTYWALTPKPAAQTAYKSWTYLHPLFLELILAFLTLTLALELNAKWHPVAWMVLAWLTMTAGGRMHKDWGRIRLYSIFFFWAAAVHVAFITSAYMTPAVRWVEQAWLSGLIAIALQLAYLIVMRQFHLDENAYYPPAVKIISAWTRAIQKKKNVWVYYPFFACLALFLYWSFDHSALTLLWVLECFMIFVLSIALRENNFRYLSFIGMVACLIRLLVHDLARTPTLIRALVFLGVGLILLAMNSIYTKYRERVN